MEEKRGCYQSIILPHTLRHLGQQASGILGHHLPPHPSLHLRSGTLAEEGVRLAPSRESQPGRVPALPALLLIKLGLH